MGREIRMVIPNWQHPKGMRRWGEEDYLPMRDRDFEAAMKDWLDGLAAWIAGDFEKCRAEHPDLNYDPAEPYRAWCTWHGDAPDPAYYRPRWKEDATWVQVYETVSEGTPVTPPFATKEELIDYLVANGDFWDQKRGNGGWNRENATAFVERGWAPSLMVRRTESSVEIKEPRDGLLTGN